MADDVKALFRKINQSHLPYQVFEPPPIEEAAADAAPRRGPAVPPAPARPPPEPRGASPSDFLRAYVEKPAPPAPPQGAPIRLKELFERLAARG